MFEILSDFLDSAASGLVAAIPSPSRNSIDIGPLTIHAYGLMIGLGMIAGVAIANRRWVKRGGLADDIVRVATWGVPAGIVGARLYHVITDWPTYANTGWINALKITNGGLGIPGGLALGILFGYIAMRRLKVDVPTFVDAALPAIPVAQAIGRLGNWFNQELFGRPTDVPWAVEISPDARERSSIPAEFWTAETFHPTFAYEAIWNLALAAVLIFITNRKLIKPGQSLFVWIAGYGVGRFLVESLRIDPASLIAGIRVNHWVSGLAVAAGIAGFLWMQRNAPSHPKEGEPARPPYTAERPETLGDKENEIGQGEDNANVDNPEDAGDKSGTIAEPDEAVYDADEDEDTTEEE